MDDAFVTFMDKCFGAWTSLFQKYGWWTAAIIGATVLIMIPINLLVKACFKKTENVSLQRLRKAISGTLVYAVSIGVLYAHHYLFQPAADWSFMTVAGEFVYVGTLAMFVWALMKIVWQIGLWPVVLPIIKKLSGNKEFKEMLERYGLDKKVVEAVLAAFETIAEKKAKESGTTLEDYLAKHQVTMSEDIKQLLAVYTKAESGEIVDIAQKLVDLVNKQHKIESK